jgi:hypothetical protein
MLIHLTRSLVVKLGVKPPEPPDLYDELLSWRANYLRKRGRGLTLFMNDATRFVVCLVEPTKAGGPKKASEPKSLSERFSEVLKDVSLYFGANPDNLADYLGELGDFEFVRNDERRKTAWLTQAAKPVLWALAHTREDVELSLVASNCMVSGSKDGKDYFQPAQKFLGALGQRYRRPALKAAALELTVTLDLGPRQAIRKLRVPASFTFPQLHRALQAAFGWRGHHPHSFGFYDDWDDVYRHPPVVELMPAEVASFDDTVTSESGVKLSEYVPKYRKILYTYDFGDNWSHFIEVDATIEDCEEELPVLISGEGDAPPEDVGGPEGFDDFLRVMADPGGEEYEESLAWSRSQGWSRFDFKHSALIVKHMGYL